MDREVIFWVIAACLTAATALAIFGQTRHWWLQAGLLAGTALGLYMAIGQPWYL